MALTQRRSAEVLPWKAFANPAFPEGSWVCALSIAQDASGDPVTAAIDFQTATSALSSRMWSLEQLQVQTLNTLGGIALQLIPRNMETYQRDQLPITGWRITQDNLPAVPGGRGLNARDAIILPIFFGAPRIAGVNAGFEIVGNNDLTNRLNVIAYGYFWGPGARTAPGGPQRPATGPWG